MAVTHICARQRARAAVAAGRPDCTVKHTHKAGGKVNWDELDPANYKTKAEVVALMEKSIADADATLKALPDDAFARP